MPRTSKTAGRGKSSKSTRVTTAKKLDSATARATRITAKVSGLRTQTDQLAKTTESVQVRTAGMNQLANVLLGLVTVALLTNIVMVIS
jgi:hypothetical protein